MKIKIEGLEELEELQYAWGDYRSAMLRAIDNGSTRFPTPPTTELKEMSGKYPAAAAYLSAKSWSKSSNFEKSYLGDMARESMEAGTPYGEAIAKMEKAWSDNSKENMWN